jgi:CheY-like chemotaxis protein
VLLAEESLPYRRVIREALAAFRVCEVDDAPTGEAAFGLALQRRYALYLFAYELPDMTGELLDQLLTTASPLVHQGTHTAPPIIYLLKPEASSAWQQLSRNARARGHVILPPRLDMLMQTTANLLPSKMP